MSTKHLRYSLSLSRLPNDCCSLAKSILANEQSNNERSFLNSLLAYGFMNRRDRDCNFFTTSFVGNTSNERLHQFSMPISEENKIFVDHILSFRQGKLRTTEYNYLLFCGFNAFIETCKRYVFSEKYLLVNLQNEIKNEIYLSGLYPFLLTLINLVDVKESEEKYYFDIYKTSINEMFNSNFQSFSDFVSRTCKQSDQSDAIATKNKMPVPVIETEVINRVVSEKKDGNTKTAPTKVVNTSITQSTDDKPTSTVSSPATSVEKTPKDDDKSNKSAGQKANSFWKGFNLQQ